ncbi:MAG TPA: hypothetical protein DCZ94_09485 [Lentisphaeria bacterium]|nr:MAG: hypothetical protein A2X48_18160 [Lentisphaerae bacterium GWF2_49_21]HBC87173.1 hypothetical protein [Lentisphaeria bacterium]
MRDPPNDQRGRGRLTVYYLLVSWLIIHLLGMAPSSKYTMINIYRGKHQCRQMNIRLELPGKFNME